ncbi:SIR2 family protein [Paenibacillus silvae]|uniref:SIR2 family protein n=1 Tax=Paenibacillus silvae TaxID=1325358 RepID=UPI0020030273|nr:SIR2 family protein [Paenibacillus silvae]MCK6075379.1 SIR2 family protein [Paenibacillus silvae]MCK6149766.1 SIR2 family protein [Paenibacillus silvae]MCK6268064.1 SIR2 family protein [Paenibacillus silvae]
MSTYEVYLNESLANLRTVMDDSGSRPIFFIGSGLSRRYINAPDWEGLLEELIDLNPKIRYPLGYYTQQANNDLAQVASLLVEEYQAYAWEQYKNEVFPKYLFTKMFHKSIFLKHSVCGIFDSLMKSFDLNNHQFSKEIELLRNLTPHTIITTNYDPLLELLFSEYNVIIGQQVIKKKEATNIGHILKIHGCVTKPEEIVISSEDYQQFADKQKYLTAKLLTYFMEHPIIFIGYSLSDKNIKSILRDISEMVSSNADEIVNNIWFIDWKRDDISPDFKPPADKTIDLGDGRTIRINYIQVNSYERLFESLNQPSNMEMDMLRNLQNNIYNIVKSKSITDLEVDLLAVKNINDAESLAKMLGFKNANESSQPLPGDRVALLGVGTISDPEQLKAMFPMRISQVAERLGLSSWYHVDQMMKKINAETGINIKESTNRYHIDIGINQAEHRYSIDSVTLFQRILDNHEYYVYDGQEKVHPKANQVVTVL